VLKWEVVVVEEEDSTASGEECLVVWEVVVDEVLHRASLGVSLSNDKVKTRRTPTSARRTMKLKATKKLRAIGLGRSSLGIRFRITSFDGLAKWAWGAYSQAFSFLLISWPLLSSRELGCTFAAKQFCICVRDWRFIDGRDRSHCRRF
jgi:hypothetical protein